MVLAVAATGVSRLGKVMKAQNEVTWSQMQTVVFLRYFKAEKINELVQLTSKF